MPDNEFTDLNDEQIALVTQEAIRRNDWVMLSKIEASLDGKNGDIGLPVKVTLNAKDVR